MYGPSHTAAERLDELADRRFVASIRRLLDEDLARARADRSPQSPGIAFYDVLPSGAGHEVKYSPFRVFNLAIAHELDRFGCKQGEVIKFIIGIQTELQEAFKRANEKHQTKKRTRFLEFDADEVEISSKTRRNRLKIYLVFRRVEATTKAVEASGGTVEEGEILVDAGILYGAAQLETYLSDELRDGLFGAFVLELSELAVRITELSQVAPARKRGRQPSEPPRSWLGAYVDSQQGEDNDD